MHIATVFTALCATGLAVPLAQPQSGASSTWTPARDSKTTCDKSSDKIISFYVGPQLEDVLNGACAAMMPDCAFPSRHPDSLCVQTVDFKLPGPVSSVQHANVEARDGNKLSGWDVKFSVTPPSQPQNDAGAFWTVQDCYGYFQHLLTVWEDKGGCHNNKGSGIGSITAGTGNSLKGTAFNVSIVKAA